MSDLQKTREAIKNAITGEEHVEESEVVEDSPEEVIATPEESGVTEEEPVEEEPAKEPAKEEPKEENKEEEEPEAKSSKSDQRAEKDAKRIGSLKDENKELRITIKSLKAQVEDAHGAIDGHLKASLKDLTDEDKKLLEEIAGGANPLAMYRALTVLRKHSKVSTGKKVSRVSVDQTRVARSPEPTGRPRTLNDARRAIREEFLKIAK